MPKLDDPKLEAIAYEVGFSREKFEHYETALDLDHWDKYYSGRAVGFLRAVQMLLGNETYYLVSDRGDEIRDERAAERAASEVALEKEEA